MMTIAEQWESFKAKGLDLPKDTSEATMEALKYIFFSGVHMGLDTYQTLLNQYGGSAEDMPEGLKKRDLIIEECQVYLAGKELEGKAKH